MSSFTWIPGRGPNSEALARMRDSFPMPREPMGEAWFMGETRAMYEDLLGDLDTISANRLQSALWEITSGVSSFGWLEEWAQWFRYLLPRLIPRAHEVHLLHGLLECLVSAFLAQYPNTRVAPSYPEFLEDALHTLGQSIMAPQGWDGKRVRVGCLLHRSNRNPNRYWGWDRASGDFASSVVFCLAYLPEDSVENWLQSMLAIECPRWRAQLLVWLEGAKPFLEGQVRQPSQWDDATQFQVGWAHAHCLDGTYAAEGTDTQLPPHLLPEASRQRTYSLLRDHFTPEVFDEWVGSIREVDELVNELGTIPDRFRKTWVMQ